MARRIIDQLFKKQPILSQEEETQAMFVSVKDWKTLISRLDRIQAQVESCNEKADVLYSRVMKWLGRMKEKLSTVSKTQQELDSTTKQAFKQWEEKILNWVQPDQRKEDQRKIMDLMHHHSQFIQSYDQQMDSVKKALSKNEYQLYQLLEQMRTVRVEIDLMNHQQQINQDHSLSSRKQTGLGDDLLNP